ncbi:MAG: pantothenate kinase [Gammaproteobacteria bacterium CG11_big_fil_rev_8_21_14_0_20_46_22]|nr:MAG: pantothenate kinase [Gammaproteobacteria bacterium CG12_big_fil_rev_8_21_14_0_65_46_12]PIR11668.1 MAG: pantothenate kinase [Gammaproteobacteria bacterium CG11_big_fil_rev_8_21_14_0_20_46_22]
MLLTLDIGNSHIFGGVFSGDELLLRFRYDSKQVVTSDQLGVFLRAVIRENGMDHSAIDRIALCSVVPSLDYSIRSACMKYFDVEPFVLQAGVKTGLNIKYRNPIEVGADRIANAIAATHSFPQKNLIIIDLGTATTFCAINQERHYLGGVIIPGIKLCMMALENNTAKLSAVEIVKTQTALGKGTAESIQSGLYFSHCAALREISARIRQETFANKESLIIGTGGFSHLFEDEKIFDLIVPDLALHGLRAAYELNHGE